MNWTQMLFQLLPLLIVGIEKAKSDLAGADKKAAVTHALQSIAQGFTIAMPDSAKAAQAAAETVIGAIDGVVATLNEVGALTKPASTVAK